MPCQQIESLLPSFVDGVARPDETRVVEAHLSSCVACREAVAAQQAVRAVLQARALVLTLPAPPGLRTRLAARAADEAQGIPVLGWGGRLTAFAAAAMVVLVVGSVALPVVTSRSTVLLAAQLVLDHLKCFTIDGDADTAPISAEQGAAILKSEYGYTFAVPQAAAAEGMRLVAVRQCLYGDGLAAHLLYRLDGAPVSLFVMPGLARPAAELDLFGQDQIVWNDGQKTYMLVGQAGAHDRLRRVASQLGNEAR